jgi:hypothetical protein
MTQTQSKNTTQIMFTRNTGLRAYDFEPAKTKGLSAIEAVACVAFGVFGVYAVLACFS